EGLGHGSGLGGRHGLLAKGWLKEAVENDGETPDIAARAGAARLPYHVRRRRLGVPAELDRFWEAAVRRQITHAATARQLDRRTAAFERMSAVRRSPAITDAPPNRCE